ncbi:MAG TPA: thermonuclease [Nocardioides bacterium]|uniref:thermonuclease family protein n=1 Tax=uncultured Nocardioides sp. TaxID=198441 RepID=UPI000EECF8E1|nr:thermonuclease family protein [uncultured Nocardioides sp.]MCB0909116.1 thermonuclease family protein [Nocardioidaceae bacterium]HCB05844.1 thermonuclease [Nocardioides sp.]HRD60648.1 thermonuclease family protein [Nocardioides sp.]
MIASKPVRLVSLAVVALVVTLGVRGVVNGFAFDGDLLDSRPAPGASGGVERTSAVVAYVLDGDTVQVTTRDGREPRVRFLGISAPEIPHTGKPGECYGQSATRHLEQLLPAGAHVMLVSDPTQDDVDDYGRWLRYVQASGHDVGAAQIRSGAAAARDSSSPVSRHATYADLEREARDRAAGMWSACH